MPDIVRVNMRSGEITRHDNKGYELLGGRALSARLLLDEVDPTCEPLGAFNKLVIANGIFAGTPASSGSRTSIGAKSPLTNGIKEANVGGNFSWILGRLGIRAIVVEDLPQNDHAHVLIVTPDEIKLEVRDDLKYLGTYDTTNKLLEQYGKNASVLCIGPAGERMLRAASVAVSDPQGELKFAARGGLGAVMGSKGLKAIVAVGGKVNKIKYHDQEAFMAAARKYTTALATSDKVVNVTQKLGTNSIFKAVNAMGALPTRNFSQGSFEYVDNLSGETLYETIVKRGGEGRTGMTCMNGCAIKCSNIYPDENGKKICSTVQYENVALLGSNCGMTNLDDVARLNHACNDLGLDTIEMGATIGVAMEMGLAEFGDVEGALKLFQEIYDNTPLGRILGNGALVTGEVLGCRRIPVAKGQAFAGYDPRALKGNGVTYAVSPMGADHTAGNCFGARNEVDPLGTTKQGDLSRNTQIKITTLDCLGICMFARPPLFAEPELLATMVNALLGTELSVDDIWQIGYDTIKMERQFNLAAGISPAQDKLPEFVYTEKLEPTGSVFDLSPEEVSKGIVE
ncbi:MAG: aldehyde ferredoxin oxidoreductase [Firmicutes bacterium]|nr:aldehyde ferredoxin oxidoreductase [Bacillota bacterium]